MSDSYHMWANRSHGIALRQAAELRNSQALANMNGDVQLARILEALALGYIAVADYLHGQLDDGADAAPETRRNPTAT